MKGKWRIIEMPDYEADFPDMVEPAYILFDGKGGGEFAFGCVTGAIRGIGDKNAVEFTWEGNDEMEEARGDGWAELQPNGSITGQICFHGGDEANFTARLWTTSPPACKSIWRRSGHRFGAENATKLRNLEHGPIQLDRTML